MEEKEQTINEDPESEYYQNLRQTEYKKSDASLFPSYTNLSVPYRVICRRRYEQAAKEQRRQFLREVATQEALQSKALDGVRIYREFCNPVLRTACPKELVKLTPKEKRRLRNILDER